MDYATWVFPRPSLSLPRFPKSGNTSLARRYLEYSLTNDTSAMVSKLEDQTTLRPGDILEPYWIDGPDSKSNDDAVNIIRLFCLQCDDDTWDDFPCKAVLNSTVDLLEVTQTFNVSTPTSRYRIELPQPDIQGHDDAKTFGAYSCALQRESSLDERVTDLDRQAFSEMFFVLGYPHGDRQRLLYNISKPRGVLFNQHEKEQAAVPGFVFPPAGVIIDLFGREFLSWPSSKRVQNTMLKSNIYRIADDVSVVQMRADIQADDVLEPRWVEYPSHPVKSLGLACILCPEQNGTALYPRSHCDNFDGPKIKEFYLPIEFSSPGGAGLEVRMPSSRYNETIAACAFHLNFSTPSGAEAVVSSRVFFVVDGPSMRKEQHRFKLTQDQGVPTNIYRVDLPESKSTDFYSSFVTSHGPRKLSPGEIAGIVLGCIFSCILAFWLWKCWRRKTGKTMLGKQIGSSQAERNSVARSEADVYLALQPRSEREVSTSSPQSGTPTNADRMGVSQRESSTEGKFEEPPPAYHKVINNSH